MPPLSIEQLQHLGSTLLEDPSSNMNNIVPLMKALTARQPKVSPSHPLIEYIETAQEIFVVPHAA